MKKLFSISYIHRINNSFTAELRFFYLFYFLTTLFSCKKEQTQVFPGTPINKATELTSSNKWLGTVSLTENSIISTIEPGDCRNAGSINLTNTSDTLHFASVTFQLAGSGAGAIESLGYEINGTNYDFAVNNNNTVVLPNITVPAKSTVNLPLQYCIKSIIPETTPTVAPVNISITKIITDENNVNLPFQGRLPGQIKLDTLLYYTAVIDRIQSDESSAFAIDKVLMGRSVAKAFVLHVTKPGTAKIEVIGDNMTDGTPAIEYYWVNKYDTTDLGVACSTMDSDVPKTKITKPVFTVNLKAGTQVVCFKTAPLQGKVANDAKLGLKTKAANNFAMENENYKADALSENLPAQILISQYMLSGGGLTDPGMFISRDFGGVYFYGLDESGKKEQTDKIPDIKSACFSTKLLGKTYPEYIDITGASEGPDYKLGSTFGERIYFSNGYYNKKKEYISLEGNYVKPKGQVFEYGDNIRYYEASATVILNFHATESLWENGWFAVGFDLYKGGWKFEGNPEMVIQGLAGNFDAVYFQRLY